MVQLELKADLNDVNESFSNKANKATVASALHRKANKGETEEALKKKVDKNELQDILEKQKEDLERSYSTMLNNERERLLGKNFRELEDIIVRKADKSEIDMYLSAVNTQKRDFDRRVQLIEKETAEILKTVQGEIESMRTSCIETLGRKVDYSEFDRLNEETHNKLGSESVMNLINQAKSDLYININEVKEEFLQGRKKYEESLYERASRAEINSERIGEDLHKVRRDIDDIKQRNKNSEQETTDYIKSLYDSSRKELKHEVGCLNNELSTFKTEITHRVDNSLLTAEFEKYKETLEEELKDKVSVDEVQRAITG